MKAICSRAHFLYFLKIMVKYTQHKIDHFNNFLFFWLCRMACGPYFPDQGSNLRPLQWKRRVLTIGLPGKSHFNHFKAYSLVVKNTLIMLCSHHHHHLQNFFIIPK